MVNNPIDSNILMPDTKFPTRTITERRKMSKKVRSAQIDRSEMRRRSLAARSGGSIFLLVRSNFLSLFVFRARKSHQFSFGFGPKFGHVPHVNKYEDSRQIFSTIWISLLTNFCFFVVLIIICLFSLRICCRECGAIMASPTRKQQTTCVGRELHSVAAKKE